MANLSQTELYKYQWRIDLFLDKYKKGDAFELEKGGTAKFKYEPKIANLVKTKSPLKGVVLTGKDKTLYRFSDLKKSREFGGGGGSGAGASLTKLVESAQAVYCQSYWNKKDFSTKSLREAYRLADTDETVTNILNKLSEEWKNSSIIGANLLYKEFGRKKFKFHRGSKWVQTLENHWKKLNRQEKTFSNLNKWSPADIWMLSAKGEKVDITKTKSISELNSLLLKNLQSRDIIGVSLKLMKTKGKLSYHNDGGKTKPVVKFQDWTTGTNGFFESKDVYFKFTVDGRIQFRTFPETFQGEIKGKNANHGKISYGPINSVLRSMKLPVLPDISPLRNSLEKKNKDRYEEFYQLFLKYGKPPKKMTFGEFFDLAVEKGTSWCFSKYLAVKLLSIIREHNMENQFISGCISYASSESELSAPFVKIS